MDKSQYKYFWIGGAFIVALFVILFSLGVLSNTFYGGHSDRASCRSYITDNLCSEGYKCFDCVDVGGGVFKADCSLAPNSAQASNNFCGGSNTVSHAWYSCYGSSVYWYNSLGVAQDVKESCPFGCTTLSLKTASCKTGQAVGGVCDPTNSKKLCTNAVYVGNIYYCDSDKIVDCPNGCSNGACVNPIVDTPVVTPPVVPDNSVDVVVERGSFDCSQTSCSDYCDSSGTSFSSGRCDSKLGGCVYSSVTVNAPSCVSTPANPDVAPSCKVYALKDGSSCGVDKVWKLSQDKNGCAVYSCVSSAPNYTLYIGAGIGALALLALLFAWRKK